MSVTHQDHDQPLLQSMQRVEALIQEIDQSADPAQRDRMQEIVQGLLDYHGAALRRIVGLVEQHASVDLLSMFSHDELVGSLLMLYDLHPQDLRERVEKALEEVRPYLKSHGGNVELVELADGVVRLRMQGSCHGCPSSAQTMKSTIEQAILAAAPDIAGIELDQADDAAPPHGSAGFVPLAALSNGHHSGEGP